MNSYNNKINKNRYRYYRNTFSKKLKTFVAIYDIFQIRKIFFKRERERERIENIFKTLESKFLNANERTPIQEERRIV